MALLVWAVAAPGFVPGGASLHNQWSAHGADRETFDLAVKSALGFAVKAGMDQLSKRLTGTPEVFAAARESGENR